MTKEQKRKWIIVLILVFVAVTLVLKLVSYGLDSWLGDAEPITEESDTDQTDMTDLAETVVTGNTDETTMDEPDTDTSRHVGEKLAQAEKQPVSEDVEPESEQVIADEPDIAERLSITEEELTSFDFSTKWVNDEGTLMFVTTSDATGLIYLYSGTYTTSLETAVSGKVLECGDYNVPHTVSDVMSVSDVSLQIVNTRNGDLYTDIFVSTPDTLIQITIDRTMDTDDIVYDDTAAYIFRQFNIELPDVSVPAVEEQQETSTVSEPAQSVEPESSDTAQQEENFSPRSDYDEPIIIR